MRKAMAWAGIIGPTFYVAATLVGSRHIPGYSHMYNTVSEVTGAGVQQLPAVHAMYAAYNLATAVLGLSMMGTALSATIKHFRRASHRLLDIGAAGILMYWFPQDPRGVAMTLTGRIHILLASIMSLFTMLVMMHVWLAFRKDPEHKGLAVYSLISLIATFVTGGFAAWAVAMDASYGGLAERMPIGLFIQWLVVFSLWLIYRSPLAKAAPADGRNPNIVLP